MALEYKMILEDVIHPSVRINRKILNFTCIVFVIVAVFGLLIGKLPEALGVGFVMALFVLVVGGLFSIPIKNDASEEAIHTSRRKAQENIRNILGNDCQYIDVEAYALRVHGDDTFVASALAYDGNNFYIAADSVMWTVPKSLIRTWKWHIDGYDATRLYGNTDFGTKIQVAQDNQNSAIKAFYRSGFFVNIADIDQPTLQFVSSKEAVLRRWNEIFAQVFDGRLPSKTRNNALEHTA
jgi:hypothetical protein